MARPREYTPEKLERAVNKYFRSITRRVVQKEMVPTGDRDDKGHLIYEPRAIINSLGKEVEITEYILPPSVADLCEALRIHRATWANYCDHGLHPELAEITEQVRERMKAWNERELLTRPGKDIKGIIFNLQTNYGYGGEKHEMELGPGAQKAMSGAPVSERAALLKELFDELQQEQEEYGAPDGARRSGSGGERTSSGASEPCRTRRGKRYGACEDDHD